MAKINEVDNLIKSVKFRHQVVRAKGRHSKATTKRVGKLLTGKAAMNFIASGMQSNQKTPSTRQASWTANSKIESFIFAYRSSCCDK